MVGFGVSRTLVILCLNTVTVGNCPLEVLLAVNDLILVGIYPAACGKLEGEISAVSISSSTALSMFQGPACALRRCGRGVYSS